jgi:hypothetical protein
MAVWPRILRILLCLQCKHYHYFYATIPFAPFLIIDMSLLSILVCLHAPADPGRRRLSSLRLRVPHAARKVLGWSKICKLAHALWEYRLL